jgi:hypothetical protein
MLRLQRIWEGDKPKLSDHLKNLKPKRVLLVFWHGLGDLVMFLNPFEALTKQFSDVIFDLAVQKGLGFEDITADLQDTNILFIDGSFFKELPQDYDIIADIDFPMSEGQTELTKGEWCCVHELGIDLVNGHKKLTKGKNRLIAIHYQITCLPDAANPNEETAKMIWDDVLESGFIPIEMLFEHTFHNPVNKMFPFIDCTVRKVRPQISTLIGLIQRCVGVICVVSGNLHVALSVLPDEKIFFLQKHFKLESFTKRTKIARASIMPGEYKREVKEWLIKLEKSREIK